MGNKKIRPVAIYLPQFHPIPENDAWWGKGFTEWANVAKTQPLFENHYQPHLPADLGFYDLRLPEVMQAQASLAASYGIKGFCFYHYWFNGKKLLERPLEEMLQSGKPAFPFMLCWANENWTRKWDGRNDEVLLAQHYSEEDDINHIHYLMKYFLDPRYIRVDNKPVFIVYKTFLFPDAEATAKRWQDVAKEYGIELYLCQMIFKYDTVPTPLAKGFDAAVDFEPFGVRRSSAALVNKYEKHSGKSIIDKIINRIKKEKPGNKLNIKEYAWMFNDLHSLKNSTYKIYPSVVPGWDNTARRQNDPALILHNSSPELFASWLQKVLEDFDPYSADENFIFINAWNEWAEGNHLEPCQKWGRQYLDVLKKELEKVSAESDE